MNKRVLLRKIAVAARQAGASWEKVRQGSRHELWELRADKRVERAAVPRHAEVNTFTAESIMKDLETILGKDWWR